MCEYVATQLGQVFINSSLLNPSLKAIDILSNADKMRPLGISNTKLGTPSSAHENERLGLSIPTSPDPGPAHLAQMLSRFIDIYFPVATHNSLRDGQTPASWAHVLPDITPTNSAYNISLAALCLTQIGIWNHDPVVRKEGSRLYSFALRELRRTIGSIGSRNFMAPEATLASIVILSTYEVSLPPS